MISGANVTGLRTMSGILRDCLFGVLPEEGDSGGVLLRDLIQLLNGAIDLLRADALLSAGGADLMHQIGGFMNAWHDGIQHFPG